ncbi:MAG: M23 family metallopeptidase [bacterium]|nr:M23 family metallopeptidase [bacterium]
MKIVIPIIIITLVLAVVGYFVFQIMQGDPRYVAIEINIPVNQNTNLEIEPATAEPIAENDILVEPIADFKRRITKKPFGIYITPDDSPVQPEKFSGYHTAVDVEYSNVLDDVLVMTIADGEVVASKTVSGYGGVVVIKHIINNETVLAIYGHLDNSRSAEKGTIVKQGETVGYLGQDQTKETDYERRHLHFGIIKGDKINFAGYVSDESELDGWYDPLIFYPNID